MIRVASTCAVRLLIRYASVSYGRQDHAARRLKQGCPSGNRESNLSGQIEVLRADCFRQSHCPFLFQKPEHNWPFSEHIIPSLTHCAAVVFSTKGSHYYMPDHSGRTSSRSYSCKINMPVILQGCCDFRYLYDHARQPTQASWSRILTSLVSPVLLANKSLTMSSFSHTRVSLLAA